VYTWLACSYRKFHLSIRKKFFAAGVVKYWNRLPERQLCRYSKSDWMQPSSTCSS